MQGTYLVHRAGKGEARKKHKYIKRDWIKGKWRYWYKDTKNKLLNRIDSIKDDLGFDEREDMKNSQNKVNQA